MECMSAMRRGGNSLIKVNEYVFVINLEALKDVIGEGQAGRSVCQLRGGGESLTSLVSLVFPLL